MLAQISVKRFRARLRQQGLQHHVFAPALGEMLAIGFAQAADAGVAVLLVDTARAANLKFLQFCREFVMGTSNSRPHWKSIFAGAPLIPKVAPELPRYHANFGIGAPVVSRCRPSKPFLAI